MTSSVGEKEEMFRPPLNRGMQTLDRALFKKTFLLSAAKIKDKKQIPQIRHALHHDMLRLDRLQTIHNIPESTGEISKALLLKPDITANDALSWTAEVQRLAGKGEVDVVPFNLELDYEYWDYMDVMRSILPEDKHDSIPTGFSIVGHVVHLNLRSEHLPYKHLIATLLLDKVTSARTVINKIDDVGAENVYRTFNYELLAGDPDLNVEISEEGCTFRFDYSKVYWNSRLNTEHRRIIDGFKPGQAICDVMAGVGPFAIPAGKKKCWVFANDLNPDSFTSLTDAIRRNKVENFVKAYNVDGHSFIKSATQELLLQDVALDTTSAQARNSRSRRNSKGQPVQARTMRRPRVFAHYVLNLPASALTFLPSFIGIYAGHEELFLPHTEKDLPVIHVYCFNAKSEKVQDVGKDICREISQHLQFNLFPGNDIGEDGAVTIWDVRDVAPNKRMFCASFRLPASVAFESL